MFSKKCTFVLLALSFGTASFAQAPAGAPAGSTGLCRDGTYWSNPTKQGACSGHKGVQTWYGAATASSANATTGSTGAAASAPTPTRAAPATVAPSAPAPSAVATAPARTQTGGAAGQVWVNTSSKVYHCPGDRYYGKTKAGTYMSESDALAQGNRADHGKACKS